MVCPCWTSPQAIMLQLAACCAEHGYVAPIWEPPLGLPHAGKCAKTVRARLTLLPAPPCPAEYVCYTELVRTAKRPYMAGLTGIEPQWLADVAAPLCTFSPPLPDPPPFYKPASDQVGWHPRLPAQ